MYFRTLCIICIDQILTKVSVYGIKGFLICSNCPGIRSFNYSALIQNKKISFGVDSVHGKVMVFTVNIKL